MTNPTSGAPQPDSEWAEVLRWLELAVIDTDETFDRNVTRRVVRKAHEVVLRASRETRPDTPSEELTVGTLARWLFEAQGKTNAKYWNPYFGHHVAEEILPRILAALRSGLSERTEPTLRQTPTGLYVSTWRHENGKMVHYEDKYGAPVASWVDGLGVSPPERDGT